MKPLYLIVGASGAGKTTVVRYLEEVYDYKSIPSYTTRPKRTEDEYGHIFVSNDDFPNENDCVGFTNYCGNKYGVTKEQFEDPTYHTYVIDTKGVYRLKNINNLNREYKTIYLKPTLATTIDRMKARYCKDNKLNLDDLTKEESKQMLENVYSRVINDLVEFKGFEADYCIEIGESDSIKYVANKIKDIIE